MTKAKTSSASQKMGTACEQTFQKRAIMEDPQIILKYSKPSKPY